MDTTGVHRFAVKVSIEKDPVAHRTLLLRAIFRKFPKGKVPNCYYDYVRGKITREQFLSHPDIKDAAEHAAKEARCAELGVTPPEEVDGWIREALGNQTDWVLIGGPRAKPTPSPADHGFAVRTWRSSRQTPSTSSTWNTCGSSNNSLPPSS